MKIAVLDLGTNTFHLLIVRTKKDGSFTRLFKSKLAVKLGEGAIHRGVIASVPFKRGLKAMKHYAAIIRKYRPDKTIAYATSAVRSAENGTHFVSRVEEETGIHVNVISGAREAELIYFGVRQCLGMDDKKKLIIDIGGGSTELIIANGKKIFWKQSFNIGAARLLETFHPSDPITKAEEKKIEKHLEKILLPFDKAMRKYKPQTLVGSSGSFDTFAEMIGWRVYKKDVLKGTDTYTFKLNDFFELHDRLLKSTTAQRMKMKGLIKMRVDMIVLAGVCTNYILRKYNIRSMMVSKHALKEGALWEIMHEGKPEKTHR